MAHVRKHEFGAPQLILPPKPQGVDGGNGLLSSWRIQGEESMGFADCSSRDWCLRLRGSSFASVCVWYSFLRSGNGILCILHHSPGSKLFGPNARIVIPSPVPTPRAS